MLRVIWQKAKQAIRHCNFMRVSLVHFVGSASRRHFPCSKWGAKRGAKNYGYEGDKRRGLFLIMYCVLFYGDRLFQCYSVSGLVRIVEHIVTLQCHELGGDGCCNFSWYRDVSMGETKGRKASLKRYPWLWQLLSPGHLVNRLKVGKTAISFRSTTRLYFQYHSSLRDSHSTNQSLTQNISYSSSDLSIQSSDMIR